MQSTLDLSAVFHDDYAIGARRTYSTLMTMLDGLGSPEHAEASNDTSNCSPEAIAASCLLMFCRRGEPIVKILAAGSH